MFFDPPSDEIDIVLVDQRDAMRAMRYVVGCESCRPTDAEVPFDWVLDYVTGRLGCNTDYVLESPATCPRCRGSILEKTFVDAEWTEAADSFQP